MTRNGQSRPALDADEARLALGLVDLKLLAEPRSRDVGVVDGRQRFGVAADRELADGYREHGSIDT